MKKSLLLVSIFLSMMSLTSCSKEYVTFYNYDGTVLYKVAYSKNMTLTYEGETPTKPSDDMYTYTFKGWNHSLYDAETSKQYFAEFTKELREFTVTFRDYNNSFISSVDVKYGDSVVDFAPTNLPDRERMISDDPDYPGYTYKFAGWSGGDLTYITSNTDFIASYDKVNIYAVMYLDNDGMVLDIDHVEEGGSSSCDVSLSYKEADSDHFYVFNGWSDDTSEIHSGLYVTAQYKLVNAYTVTFKNYDGTVLYTVKVPEGGTAVYRGSTPYRSSTSSGYVQTSYTFSGWDMSLENVRRSFSTTAVFSTSSVDNSYAQTRDYIINNGSGTGSTRIIKTGTYTTLNWFLDKSQFNIAFNQTEGSYIIGIGYTFNAFSISEGSMMIISTSTSETLYWSNFTVYVSNHRYSSLSSSRVQQSKYNSSDWNSLMRNYEINASQMAIDNCSNYLSSHGLPYIF